MKYLLSLFVLLSSLQLSANDSAFNHVIDGLESNFAVSVSDSLTITGRSGFGLHRDCFVHFDFKKNNVTLVDSIYESIVISLENIKGESGLIKPQEYVDGSEYNGFNVESTVKTSLLTSRWERLEIVEDYYNEEKVEISLAANERFGGVPVKVQSLTCVIDKF